MVRNTGEMSPNHGCSSIACATLAAGESHREETPRLIHTTEERLYAFFAKHLYPRDYRFNDEDVQVFRDAVHLGFVSDCASLSAVDLAAYDPMPLGEVRAVLGIEEDLLRAYYAIEKRRYPGSPESRRLLD